MIKIIIWAIVVIFLKAIRDRATWGWDTVSWLGEVKWLDWWKNLPTPFDLWHVLDGLIVFFPIGYLLFKWLEKNSGVATVHDWTWLQYGYLLGLLVAFWVVMFVLLMRFLYHYWLVKK